MPSSAPHSSRRPLSLRLVRAAVAGTLVVPSLAACSSNRADQYANCVDRNNVVVEARYCDEPRYYGGGGYFIFMGPSLFGNGYSVPYGNRGGYINPGDSSARSRAGLPSAGKVGGSSVHSGGIGSGSGGKSSGS